MSTPIVKRRVFATTYKFQLNTLSAAVYSDDDEEENFALEDESDESDSDPDVSGKNGNPHEFRSGAPYKKRVHRSKHGPSQGKREPFISAPMLAAVQQVYGAETAMVLGEPRFIRAIGLAFSPLMRVHMSVRARVLEGLVTPTRVNRRTCPTTGISEVDERIIKVAILEAGSWYSHLPRRAQQEQLVDAISDATSNLAGELGSYYMIPGARYLPQERIGELYVPRLPFSDWQVPSNLPTLRNLPNSNLAKSMRKAQRALENVHNPKAVLQEALVAINRREPLVYSSTLEDDTPHAPTWRVTLRITGLDCPTFMSTPEGTKKEAEQSVSRFALEHLLASGLIQPDPRIRIALNGSAGEATGSDDTTSKKVVFYRVPPEVSFTGHLDSGGVDVGCDCTRARPPVELQLFIRNLDGHTVPLSYAPEASIGGLMIYIAHLAGVPLVDLVVKTMGGATLNNGSLNSNGVSDGDTLSVSLLIAGGKGKAKGPTGMRTAEIAKLMAAVTNLQIQKDRNTRKGTASRKVAGARSQARPPRPSRSMAHPISSGLAPMLIAHELVTPGSVKNSTFPSVYTTAATTVCAITMAPTSAGDAVAYIIPCVTSDSDAIVYSGPTASLTYADANPRTNGALTGFSGSVVNAPIAGGTFVTAIGIGSDYEHEARINGVGIKITYTGPEINRSGMIYVYHNGTNDDASNVTMARMISAPETVAISVNTMDKPFEICYMSHDPVTNQMMGGLSGIYPWSVPGTTGYYNYTKGTISGAAAMASIRCVGLSSTATIRVDLTLHCEYSGGQFACFSSPTSPDTDDFNGAQKLAGVIMSAKAADPSIHSAAACAAHSDEKIAATALAAASAAGLPGASLMLGADKMLMSKSGTAATSALGKMAKSFF